MDLDYMTIDDSHKTEMLKAVRRLKLSTTVLVTSTPKLEDCDLYELHRREANDLGAELLPEFLKECDTQTRLIEYMRSFGPYAARRVYIDKEFAPILAVLEGSPGDASTSVAFSVSGIDDIKQMWIKCIERRESDPSGAVTTARSLLETVCKHIIDDDQNKDYEDDRLIGLYSKAVTKLNIHPNSVVDRQYRDLMQGCMKIVDPIGIIRNKTADSHGKGPDSVAVSVDEATLIVNVASSLSAFLIAKWKHSSNDRDNPFLKDK